MIQLLIIAGILSIIIGYLMWKLQFNNKAYQNLALDNEKLKRKLMEARELQKAQKINRVSFWSWNLSDNALACDEHFFTDLEIEPDRNAKILEQWAKFFHPDDFDEFLSTKERICASKLYGDFFEMHVRMRKNESENIWFMLRATVTQREPFGKALNLQGMFVDVNRFMQNQQHIQALLERDVVTNAYTRYYFEKTIEELTALGLPSVGFIYCDVDGLKMLNDGVGHLSGDNLLKTVCSLLRTTIRASDSIIRLGGDEFLIILLNYFPEVLARTCNAIDTVFAQYNSDKSKMPVFISYGKLIANLGEYKWNAIQADLEAQMQKAKLDTKAEKHARIKEWLSTQNVEISAEDQRTTLD